MTAENLFVACVRLSDGRVLFEPGRLYEVPHRMLLDADLVVLRRDDDGRLVVWKCCTGRVGEELTHAGMLRLLRR